MSKPSKISFKEFYPLAFCEPVDSIVCAPSQKTAVRGLAAPSAVRARIRAERREQWRELSRTARDIAVAHGGEPSVGAYVLMSRSHLLFGYCEGTSTRLESLDLLRSHAARAIGAGC